MISGRIEGLKYTPMIILLMLLAIALPVSAESSPSQPDTVEVEVVHVKDIALYSFDYCGAKAYVLPLYFGIPSFLNPVDQMNKFWWNYITKEPWSNLSEMVKEIKPLYLSVNDTVSLVSFDADYNFNPVLIVYVISTVSDEEAKQIGYMFGNISSKYGFNKVRVIILDNVTSTVREKYDKKYLNAMYILNDTRISGVAISVRSTYILLVNSTIENATREELFELVKEIRDASGDCNSTLLVEFEPVRGKPNLLGPSNTTSTQYTPLIPVESVLKNMLSKTGERHYYLPVALIAPLIVLVSIYVLLGRFLTG